jgi:hypothetical protein
MPPDPSEGGKDFFRLLVHVDLEDVLMVEARALD